MKTPFIVLAAGLVMLLPLVAQAKIDRVVEKSFTVAPGGTVRLESQGGNLEVRPGSGNEVKVVARQRFRADSEDEADSIAKNLTLTIEQNGNDVEASARFGQGTFRWGRTPVSVDFIVTVPSTYNAELKTSGGNLHVGDLTGRVDGRTSGGNIEIGRVDGVVQIRTSGGNISVMEALRSVDANTSGGDIRVKRVVGEAKLHTSGGNIRVESATGVVQAETSGGNVSAQFADGVPSDCLLRTSGGNVSVTVPASAAFRLDASTSGGNVRADTLTMSIEEGQNGKSKLVAAVNGGGPLLKLRTSGGDVRVATK